MDRAAALGPYSSRPRPGDISKRHWQPTVDPEAAKYLADRDIESVAKSTVFNNRPDALCVSGLTAGSMTDTSILKRVKDTVPDTVVFANTGVRPENVAQQLSIADGAVVGTTFKTDGRFENHVDEKRVADFMKIVRGFRK